IELEAKHSGYKSLFGGCIHSRKLKLEKQRLTVRDEIIGDFDSAVARFYFHPALDVTIDKNLLYVEGQMFLLSTDLNNSDYKLKKCKFWPEFGKSENNYVLEINLTGNLLETNFYWKFKK
ncbi:MAG: heparinase II/III family protein, partial [Gammaproteobacteria bacterium]|nr:heparinase II/III family protein [Gammaproteobacteria bacterium]